MFGASQKEWSLLIEHNFDTEMEIRGPVMKSFVGQLQLLLVYS